MTIYRQPTCTVLALGLGLNFVDKVVNMSKKLQQDIRKWGTCRYSDNRCSDNRCSDSRYSNNRIVGIAVVGIATASPENGLICPQ